MGIVQNKIEIPLSAPLAAASRGTRSLSPNPELSGKVTNGHTRVFAEVGSDALTTVDIKFSVEVNSVDVATFDGWRNQLRAKEILGPALESEIAEFCGIDKDCDEPAMYASSYSVAVLSYLSTGNYTIYNNRTDVAFTPKRDIEFKRLMKSIYRLNSEPIELAGELTATNVHPHVEAYVAASYFKFSDGRVTSFVGYRGSLILIDLDDDGKEIETPSRILAPAPAHEVSGNVHQ